MKLGISPQTRMGKFIMTMPIDTSMGHTYEAGQHQIRNALIDIAERLGEEYGELTLCSQDSPNFPGKRTYLFVDDHGMVRGSLSMNG